MIIHTISDEDIAETRAYLLKALANPVRQRILTILNTHGDTMTVNKLAEHFTIAQPTISHHLRILYGAGLLRRRKDGVRAYYSIRHEAMDMAASIVSSFA